ncbi:mitogen-activated protein kinase kinase kinase 18-like [Mercurialis annua]|uniref:mitogen-activated protein kinase kinase kinase 18-like n=1 Tax=Mercurialis annua TaxID=3986 RepID=UPI00215FF244|nr:mitogen-activated protein kinase kinase kinase 18-like [Mercurialis annua]
MIHNSWSRGRILGRGSTATVSIATAHQAGLVFAVKSAELSESEFLQKEQRILSAITSCPQIVAYKGFDVTREDGKLFYNVFLEYAPGGTLADAIREHGGCLYEDMIRSYAKNILLGLEHLHSNGIVHCDIKTRNILVSGDGLKIADLGCARKVNDDEVLANDWDAKTPIAGTPVYMAPEVARGEHQSFPADVWALGCTVVEMTTGRAPWSNVSDAMSALYQIGYSGNVPEIPSSMSKRARDFITQCLKREPTERWSASELLKHDFITEEPTSVSSSNSYVDTPTSVLDQALWEDMEATLKGTNSFPAERIKQLTGATSSNYWALDDDSWLTVRSKDSHSVDFYEASITDSWSEIFWFRGEHNLNNVIPNEPTNIGGISTLYITNSGNCKDNICRCIKIDDVNDTCNFVQEKLIHSISALNLTRKLKPNFSLISLFCMSFLSTLTTIHKSVLNHHQQNHFEHVK